MVNDLISRQAAIEALEIEYKAVGILGEQWVISQCIDVIKHLPSAQRKVLKYTGESICLNCWTRDCDGCLFEPMEGVTEEDSYDQNCRI